MNHLNIVLLHPSRLSFQRSMQQLTHLRYSHETHRLSSFIGLQRYLHFNSACILAYGQTSSGKTYTMKGEEDNFGLIPQTIREIFKKIREN